MATQNIPPYEVVPFKPSLVVLLWDRFTGSDALAGAVNVHIGTTNPLFEKAPSQFVFANLANGSYTVNVESAPDEPYYLPVDIPVTLPFPRPTDTLWNPPPVWPGYPDIVLADPNKMLNDPEQTAAYLGQRSLATLSPTTAYPFPVGATLVRGVVTGKGTPLSGALVTTAMLAQPGQFSIVVVNPGGTTSAAQILSVVQTPIIESINPATVMAGAPNFALTAVGGGFVPGAVLTWNGSALPTEFVSNGALMAEVNEAQVRAAATVSVNAVNPNGTASSPQTLIVAAAPTIVSINPPAVAAGNPALILAVMGSVFTPSAVVFLNGAAVPTTFVNSTQLHAQVSAAQVAHAAQVSVLVIIPGPPQQSSNTTILAVVSTPVIYLLEPATVVEGTPAFTLNINGGGFVAGTVAALGGTVLPTQFLGATELTAQVTAAQVASIGQLSISVSNPGGAASNAQNLAVVAAPGIASLNPGAVTPGNTPFALDVRGSGFVSGSVVELNGTALSTTFVDNTELVAHVPRSGYITGDDGTFVLFFDDVDARGETVTLNVSHASFPNAKSVNVAVQRGATVSIDIDMSS